MLSKELDKPCRRIREMADIQYAVVVGTALPPAMVDQYSLVSSAAAQWQLGFAAALSSEFRAQVTCLSFLPVTPRELREPLPRATVVDGVTIIPVPRPRRLWGSLRYAWRMFGHILDVSDRVDAVFCYNALIWTAPWAFLLARLARVPMVFIIADLEPMDRLTSKRGLLALVERSLMRLADRYVLLSPETQAVLPQGARFEIFGGLPNEDALSLPPGRYTGDVRFVYAGSLSQYAGVGQFLAAAAVVVARHPECEFYVFGRGMLEVPIPDALMGRVVFKGYVSNEELNAFLGTNCVGVNPRPNVRGENRFNAPYKLLYYCSRGIATITTITPGVPSEMASNCVIADPGVGGLACAMERAVALTTEDLEALGLRARETVRATRSPAVLAESLRRLLAPM